MVIGVSVLELRDAAVGLGGRTIWSEVSLTIEQGEFVAILGPNGAGKSTLLSVLLGLLPTSEGSVSVLGGAPGANNQLIGYLPQRRAFDPSMRVRGVDLVRLGLEGRRWGVPLPALRRRDTRAQRTRERVEEVIELVGASTYAQRPIGECSGGEQQRLLIAQALVRRPQMLVLDEPLDGLDLSNQASMAALVQRVCRAEGVAVLLVAHDPNPLLPYLDRVLYLAGGRAVLGTPREVIDGETLSKLYGAPIEVLQTTDGRLVVVGQPEGVHAHGHHHAPGEHHAHGHHHAPGEHREHDYDPTGANQA
jgi:zinc/manganese transport system ATP-binding protein